MSKHKHWKQDDETPIERPTHLPADVTSRVWFSMSRVPGHGNVAVHRLAFGDNGPSVSVVVDEDLPDFAMGRLVNVALEELIK